MFIAVQQKCNLSKRKIAFKNDVRKSRIILSLIQCSRGIQLARCLSTNPQSQENEKKNFLNLKRMRKKIFSISLGVCRQILILWRMRKKIFSISLGVCRQSQIFSSHNQSGGSSKSLRQVKHSSLSHLFNTFSSYFTKSD